MPTYEDSLIQFEDEQPKMAVVIDELDQYPINFKNKYQKYKYLGQGAQGAVIKYEIINISDDDEFENQCKRFVAIKFEEIANTKTQTLLNESLICKKLSMEKGLANVPKYFEHGFFKDGEASYNYLIMESLEISFMNKIQDSIENLGEQETSAYLQLVTTSLILSLKTFHSSGYVHLDIKPDNIMIRRNQDKNEFCFIDLGTSLEYMDNFGIHKRFKQTGAIRGTTVFASKNSLMMYELSRRDDLESLFLTMIYIINKLVMKVDGFPYQKDVQVEDNSGLRFQILSNKITQIVDEYLFKGDHSNWVTKQIIKCIKQVRKLRFEEEPDYQILIDTVNQQQPQQLQKVEEQLDLAPVPKNLPQNQDQELREQRQIQQHNSNEGLIEDKDSNRNSEPLIQQVYLMCNLYHIVQEKKAVYMQF
eukprot:403357434